MIFKVINKIDQEIEPRCESSMLEFHNEYFHRLVYDQLGISFRKSREFLQREFWKTSFRFTPGPGIYELLEYLSSKKIRMGIAGNRMFSSKILEWELKKITPEYAKTDMSVAFNLNIVPVNG